MPTLADAPYAALEKYLAGLAVGTLIPEEDVRLMCEKAKEILAAESNVVPVKAPITIVRARAPRRRRCPHDSPPGGQGGNARGR